MKWNMFIENIRVSQHSLKKLHISPCPLIFLKFSGLEHPGGPSPLHILLWTLERHIGRLSLVGHELRFNQLIENKLFPFPWTTYVVNPSFSRPIRSRLFASLSRCSLRGFSVANQRR